MKFKMFRINVTYTLYIHWHITAIKLDINENEMFEMFQRNAIVSQSVEVVSSGQQTSSRL